jgi:poly-gamma-glutamate synthesis protein (capsule biosynthesis protein)
LPTEPTTVSVVAVGDVFPDVPDARAAFRPLEPLFAAADVVFGNCEGVYSDRPAPSPSHKHFMGAPAERGARLGEIGFDVMTCANNHIVDGGYVGLEDTLELLHSQGIAVTGAGANIDEALRPAVVERKGLRLAFLGFCSVYPVGYEARPSRPGLAPLRVRTFYADPDPTFWEPGIDPAIVTVPMRDDLERYGAAIERARAEADFLVVACHWGYSSWVEVLQDYELELARTAVEHGADAVVCHHHHSLRGIELYRGKPIFYGLGALVHHFESFHTTDEDKAARRARFGDRSSFVEHEGLPLFPFRADAWRTGLATFDVSADGAVATGFIPALMAEDGSTEPLREDDPRAAEVVGYVERLTRQSGFDTPLNRSQRDGWMMLEVG